MEIASSPSGHRLALVLSALVSMDCSAPPARAHGPLGVLPTAVTSATPEWIPFSIRAGRLIAADPRETHLGEIRQLTDDGSSSAAHWHPDGRHIVFERRVGKTDPCPQLIDMRLGDGEQVPTSARGASARSASVTGGGALIFAGGTESSCRVGSQLWNRTSFKLMWSQTGQDAVALDAAGSVAAPSSWFPADDDEGARAVFSSARDGDPELYVMALKADANATRITHAAGVDTEPRFSPDGSKLVWRASRPGENEKKAYETALDAGTIPLSKTQILLAGSDGQHPVVLASGANSSQPTFLPDSRRVIFSSDYDASERLPINVDLYLVDPQSGLSPARVRLTHHDGFDGEAEISADGRFILFTSSRGAGPGKRNLFVAEWRNSN